METHLPPTMHCTKECRKRNNDKCPKERKAFVVQCNKQSASLLQKYRIVRMNLRLRGVNQRSTAMPVIAIVTATLNEVLGHLEKGQYTK